MRRSLILAALALASTIGAQELPFSHFTPDDQVSPLPSASVQKIIQDDLGYIWMAFYSSGLTRYDGHSMENYSVADGLDDLTVREIVEDAGGRLWVGSESGLVVSEKPLRAYGPGERVRFVATVGGAPLVRTRIRRNCVAAARDGWVWVGTQDGILRYSLRGDRLVTAPPIAGGVVCLLARRDGSVIAGRTDGTLVDVTNNRVLQSIRAAALMEARDGALWIGTVSGQVYRVILSPAEGEGSPGKIGGDPSPSARLRMTPIDTGMTERIVSMVESRNGEVWVASLGTGAVRIAGGSVTRVNGLLGETLWSLTEDREGNLWFAQNGGASRLRKDYRAFEAYTARAVGGAPPSLPDASVFAVIPPAGMAPWGDSLWAGTSGGAAAVSHDGTATLRVADGLLSNSVYSLAFDGKGRLWIGGVGGVNCLTLSGNAVPPPLARSTSRTLVFRGLPATLTSYPLDVTYAIRVFGDNVWMIGSGGAAALLEDGWHLYRTDAGLPPTGGTSIAVDDAGYVWISTTDNGLYRSTTPGVPQKFAPAWTAANGAPSNSIRSLLWRDGKLWVGTSDGLAILSTQPPRQMAMLPSRELGGGFVVGMAASPKSGNVWLSQNAGLLEIDGKTFRIVSRVSKADGL
ncbi:MAG TPA: two-component regulator propeller domain-containing protein, partial [Thermoanaerobaculia bacterium]|nr:two-component regulator propeller domain-containing protein [Thermoanaerobaculia bacterium]